MCNHEDKALAADLELARQFGLKGFTEAPDPASADSPSAKHLDPDGASADLALAKSFGLKGFADEAPYADAPPLTSQPSSENPDLQLARAFGLKGFVEARDVRIDEPAAQDRPASASSNRPVRPAPTVAAPDISAAPAPAAKGAPRKTSTKKVGKGQNFLQISGSRDALASLEKQMGRPLATTVRGRPSYHHNKDADGSETRLFSISSLTAASLSAIQGEVAPGVTVSTAPADLKHFRAVGHSASSPAPIQPDLVAALKRVAPK